jgi:3-hydroxyisobutyrate dehydrogenase
MKAGFIGLGALGRAMAQHLIEEGVELVVWNRTLAKTQGLHASVADSPASVIEQAPHVFINVRDSQAVEDVLTAQDGILAADCDGKIIIDTTTNHFEAVARFHALVAEAGGAYLEAPVMGSVVPASKGALSVLVSGEKVAFEEALPFLNLIGSQIFFLEQIGLASKMKVINNLVLGVFMAGLAEAVALGEAAGLDKTRVLELLAAGAGKSGILSAKQQKLIDDDFSPHFSAAMIYKDLHYLQDLARTLERPLFTGSAVKELYGMTFPQGVADQDFSVIYALFRGGGSVR